MTNIRMSKDERLDQIYRILCQTLAPLTAKQIASRVGLSKTVAWRYLKELERDGDLAFAECSQGYGIPTRFFWASNRDDHNEMFAMVMNSDWREVRTSPTEDGDDNLRQMGLPF